MNIEIKENIELASFTTYKIGGEAKNFVEANDEEQIVKAINWAKEQKMPYFVLGGGSNILISDKGFDGLVVQIHNTKYMIHNTKIEAEAGIDLSQLIQVTIDSGLKGLEWASGIPGTFGGAIRGNAGAFGGEIKDIISSVKFLDENGKIKTLDNADCKFSYRDSIFKQNPQLIILSANINLKPGNKEELDKFSRDTIAYRTARHPLEYGSCGSVFKAIDAGKIAKDTIARYPRLKDSIKSDPFPVVPAACFIDEADLKGQKMGGAMISTKHPNFFVNYNNATADEVIMLISLAKQRMVDKFGIMTEEELQYVGF